jgi:SAM-dependent methyltransferase
MSHKEQQDFLTYVRDKFPTKFENCRVLDIGSLDINGNNRYLFTNYEYVGLDIGEGNNVDVVCRGHEYKNDKQFDVIVSSECFEHDEFWELTIKNGIDLLKPNGIFLFTCATTGRPEHGTLRTTPDNAPFLSNISEKWGNYYKNLTEDDIRSVINVNNIFTDFGFEYEPVTCDLYFWGIKK